MAGAGLAKGADFLSLDVEGAEELVIRTVDPSIFRVNMVEMDQYNLPKNAGVDAYIRRAGLRMSDRVILRSDPPRSRSFLFLKRSASEVKNIGL